MLPRSNICNGLQLEKHQQTKLLLKAESYLYKKENIFGLFNQTEKDETGNKASYTSSSGSTSFVH